MVRVQVALEALRHPLSSHSMLFTMCQLSTLAPIATHGRKAFCPSLPSRGVVVTMPGSACGQSSPIGELVAPALTDHHIWFKASSAPLRAGYCVRRYLKIWRLKMADTMDANASEKPYDAVYLAKKHRITVEDAKKIIETHGADRKASDKTARRIAV
jgi:hypothetical protein